MQLQDNRILFSHSVLSLSFIFPFLVSSRLNYLHLGVQLNHKLYRVVCVICVILNPGTESRNPSLHRESRK